jgi:hypothetical protein
MSVDQATKKGVKTCANGHTLKKVLRWSVCPVRDCIFFAKTGTALKGLDDDIQRLLARVA